MGWMSAYGRKRTSATPKIEASDVEPAARSGRERLPIAESRDFQGEGSAQAFRSVRTSASHTGPCHRSEEHTSELQSRPHPVCRLLLEKKKKKQKKKTHKKEDEKQQEIMK